MNLGNNIFSFFKKLYTYISIIYSIYLYSTHSLNVIDINNQYGKEVMFIS